MKIELVKVEKSQSNHVLKLYQFIFSPYLKKYHDDEINPANTPITKIDRWFDKEFMSLFFIKFDEKIVGIVRLAHVTWDFEGQDKIHIGDFGILPDYQNLGLGQMTIKNLNRCTILKMGGNYQLFCKKQVTSIFMKNLVIKLLGV
ncbi:GNAT family N-acetyltransferase [Lactococcus lactis]|nr:GNAT family N-acetyltransferase [Lactococcus lactis]